MSDPRESWNNVIRSFIRLRNAWNKHARLMEERPQLGGYDDKAQKLLSLGTMRSSFETGIQRMINIWKMNGGIEELLLTIEKKEKDNG